MRSSTQAVAPPIGQALAKSVNFELTIVDIARRSERRAWWVATSSLLVSLILLGGYFYVLPLKEKVPYLVMADAYTGTSTVARLAGDFSRNSITASEAINRSNVAHFVLARDVRADQGIVWPMVVLRTGHDVLAGSPERHGDAGDGHGDRRCGIVLDQCPARCRPGWNQQHGVTAGRDGTGADHADHDGATNGCDVFPGNLGQFRTLLADEFRQRNARGAPRSNGVRSTGRRLVRRCGARSRGGRVADPACPQSYGVFVWLIPRNAPGCDQAEFFRTRWLTRRRAKSKLRIANSHWTKETRFFISGCIHHPEGGLLVWIP